MGTGGETAREEHRRRVREARKAAGITQAELGRRLNRSQAFVSLVETGGAKVTELFVGRVLSACALPPEWGAPARLAEVDRSWEKEPWEVAGLDPVTFELVRHGTPRDLELAERYEFWRIRRQELLAHHDARRAI